MAGRPIQPPKTGRPGRYPINVVSQVSPEQKAFINSECEKLNCTISEYIRLIIADQMPEKEYPNESICL